MNLSLKKAFKGSQKTNMGKRWANVDFLWGQLILHVAQLNTN